MSKHSERVTKQLISMQQEVLALRKENDALKQRELSYYAKIDRLSLALKDVSILGWQSHDGKYFGKVPAQLLSIAQGMAAKALQHEEK